MSDDRTEIEVFLCRNTTEWPLTVFENESHVVAWLKDGDRDRKTVHRATILIGDELELVETLPRFERRRSH